MAQIVDLRIKPGRLEDGVGKNKVRIGGEGEKGEERGECLELHDEMRIGGGYNKVEL
jgi:hypothetical protein